MKFNAEFQTDSSLPLQVFVHVTRRGQSAFSINQVAFALRKREAGEAGSAFLLLFILLTGHFSIVFLENSEFNHLKNIFHHYHFSLHGGKAAKIDDQDLFYFEDPHRRRSFLHFISTPIITPEFALPCLCLQLPT